MSKRDYYKVLGLEKNASDSEIKKAYRKLSKKYHPDVNPNGEAEFKEVAEAYDTLSKKDLKENYDRYGHNGPSQHSGGFGGGFNMDDIFSQFDFGSQRQRQRRGRDVVLNVKITLEDVLNGATKKFKYKRMTKCEPCNGVGGKTEETCSTCKGHGHVFHERRTQMGTMRQMSSCHTCGGEGKIVKDPCKVCNGKGVSNKEDVVEVNIPQGIREGDAVRYNGKGHAIKGGESGHLIIQIFIQKHKDFIRNGSDLRHQVNLSYPDLVLGCKTIIPTIDGKDIRITIPPHSKPGDTLRIVNKGVVDQRSGLRGDMMVILEIEMPVKSSDEEKELIENLRNITSEVATSEKE